MSTETLSETVRALAAPGKGILAADESTATMTKRLASIDVASTPETRLAFRELLFTAEGLEEHVAGVILYDETIRQSLADGTPVPAALARHGVLTGIKVDTGAKPLAGTDDESVTEGLDGLRDRVAEYRDLGATFAKWRAIFTIGDDLPSHAAISANAHALARYAALCQEGGLVPIVEPEVLMDGDHGIEQNEAITTRVLDAVFVELRRQRVALEHLVLKPNMVLPGTGSTRRAFAEDVADATLRTLRRAVPASVPVVAFLSGGQSDADAIANLTAINGRGPQPWALTFSFGRALQAAALRTWGGDPSRREDAVESFLERVRGSGAAAAPYAELVR